MFGYMKAEPILALRPASSLEEAIRILVKATDGARPVDGWSSLRQLCSS